jgi:hypothetical protein
MTSSKLGGQSTPAVRQAPPDAWDHAALARGVRDALLSLPLHFRTETVIEGISAVDIFTLNAALGATIENQVVAPTASADVVVRFPKETAISGRRPQFVIPRKSRDVASHRDPAKSSD